MQILHTTANLRALIKEWRSSHQTLALVPTMGNLHDGHLALVDRAKSLADRVIVSIFVNPSQFAPGEDYENYPRTEQEDQQKLTDRAVDALFLPGADEIYAADAKTVVTVGDISRQYCGAFRPGHFDGVATIVGKLFNLAQPDFAVFGNKDYQQLIVIRTMVRDLNIPITIFDVDTVRESNGLAMSSRNNYLTSEEKMIAATLYQTLQRARDAILAGSLSFDEVESQALLALRESGFQPDYFNVCNADDLSQAKGNNDTDLVILTAARLGSTRLIDNIRVCLM